MAWKPWQLDTPYMSGPEVLVIKDKLWRKFGWVRDKFPQLAPAGRTNVYDEPTSAAVMEFQFRAGLRADGIADYTTKVRLGVVVVAAPVLTTFLSVTGTGGARDNGFGFDVGVRLDPKRFRHQPVGYNTSAFLMGDPTHSYRDAEFDGVNELNRLCEYDRGPKWVSGYSMGANVVADWLNQWPTDRASEIKGVIQFGDPSRPPGKTLLGNDPGGHGISEHFPPDWVLNRYYSFSIDGDMYPNATGLLPQLYQILVRLEATPEFAMYLFGLLLNSVTGQFTQAGGQLLGLIPGGNLLGAGALSGLLPMLTPGGITTNPAQTGQQVNLLAMILNIPAIVQTIVTALQFLITGAHGHYGDQPVFGGLTGVDRAVQIVQAA
jgi:peptidoglycan hydrolase-like protein with peptidoglycan-binding domain